MVMSVRKKKRKNLWGKCRICFVCQKLITDYADASIEHVIPKSLGGTFQMRNLALSHLECNRLRGAILCRVVWEYEFMATKSR
jgi:5-methylcytosine-specific restriction endonuclease McrA